MLSFFFFFAYSYHSYIGNCFAILDVYKYDLTRYQNQQVFIEYHDDYLYYIRVCPEIHEAYVEDVFLLQCPKQVGPSCKKIITQNSLNFKPRNPNNFSEGVIYYAESEPFTDDNINYKTLDLKFDLICDPSETSSTLKLDFTYDDQSAIGEIVGRGRTSAACPIPTASPSPTPVYEPDCQYTKRKQDDPTVGIDGDLALLNDGPYGVKTFITIDNQSNILYYQACERMLCPPTFTCSTNGYSSAWLCDENERTCVSYGVGVDDIDLRQVDSSLANGMIYRMNDTSTGKSIELTLTCSETFPEGHILWSDVGIRNDNVLSIGGKNKEFCVKVIPTPKPPPVGGPCFFNATVRDSSVTIDLQDYNLGETGWTADVTVDSSVFHPDSKLIYQPCGPILCPPDTYCDGDEDAQIWLCYTENDLKQCIGYGLYKNNVSLSLVDPSAVNNGILGSYKGDNRRFADVTFHCNEQLGQNELLLPNYVTLNNRKLSFYVQAKEACPVQSPTPTPPPGPPPTPTPMPIPWHPKKPTKPIQPTPTPYPTVSPLMAIYNDTNYVEFSLDKLKQIFFEGTVLVTHKGETSNLLMNWHPWILSDCPVGYNCDDFVLANLWMCWTENNNLTKYCHPVADKYISVDARMAIPGSDEVSNGIVLNYGGGYGFETKIAASCNPFDTESFKFDEGVDITYYDDNNGKLLIILDSKLACSKRFETPNLPPTPAPTPTANPQAKVNRQFTSDEINNQVMTLNLNEFDSVNQIVLVKSNHNVYKSFLSFNPKGVDTCPNGFECLSGSKSTVWNCLNSTTKNNVCIPIGDDRFGIHYQLSYGYTNNNEPQGIIATYSSGYNEYSSKIYFFCNKNLLSDIVVNQTGELINNEYRFYIETSKVCSIPVIEHRSNITGGAIFLIIVATISSLYIGVGMLAIFVRTGQVGLPNSVFWQEFGECVQIAVIYIISCGKNRNHNVNQKQLMETDQTSYINN